MFSINDKHSWHHYKSFEHLFDIVLTYFEFLVCVIVLCIGQAGRWTWEYPDKKISEIFVYESRGISSFEKKASTGMRFRVGELTLGSTYIGCCWRKSCNCSFLLSLKSSLSYNWRMLFNWFHGSIQPNFCLLCVWPLTCLIDILPDECWIFLENPWMDWPFSH